MSLPLVDFYIAHRFAALGLALDSEEIDWSFSESLRDYVNTCILFRAPRLLSVLAQLLETLAEKPGNQEKCRKSDHYLRLWITGFETLYQQAQDPALLPFTHPVSSGRFDLLMRPDPRALLSLDEETYLKVTDQHRLPPVEQLSLDAFAATEPYWTRFMDYLAKQMADICQTCFVRLSDFRLKSHVEPDLVRTFTFPLGRIEIIRRPQALSDLEVYEFEPDYLVLYVDEVADGLITPVALEARVVFYNGLILKSFTADIDVEDADAMVSRDYREVVSEALEWVREQFDMSSTPNVVALPSARRVDAQAA
ncbi:hypothetical protein RDT67_28750 [Serratia fonticola]|uniref:Uncharacterized protein n=1 Tax=Serratia fonticola TaxID=47917 RepID=A0AAJ1YHK3_SERFO|nr:hypothetical protein [Serratia fonticola]MDQ9130393.1 hypothetical protein [Serratia fonticola]